MSFPSHFLTHLLKASIPIRKKKITCTYLQETYSLGSKCWGPCLCWRKDRDSACPGSSRGGQPNMFRSSLKHRERKKYIFMTKKKKKGFNDHTSKNINQSMKSLYTACFPPMFLFFLESYFLVFTVNWWKLQMSLPSYLFDFFQHHLTFWPKG